MAGIGDLVARLSVDNAPFKKGHTESTSAMKSFASGSKSTWRQQKAPRKDISEALPLSEPVTRAGDWGEGFSIFRMTGLALSSTESRVPRICVQTDA